MSNVHRFKPRRKTPPPRRRLPWAQAAWLPWVLVLVGAIALAITGAGEAGTALAAVSIALVGAWLDRRA